MSKKTVILAFSGGLDTSAIVPWLIEEMGADVIGYCADLGNAPQVEKIEPWAKKLGVSEFIFEDLKQEFADRFVMPAIRAGAIYQDEYLLGTPLGRPLIAERLVAMARKFGARAIVHGCTGKGNDQLRFEQSIAYLAPDLEIIAPWRMWNFKGRQDLTKYLADRDFFVPAKDATYSEDINLLHRSCEGGVLENLDKHYDSAAVMDWVSGSGEAKPTTVEIGFEAGLPTSLNGEFINSAKLLFTLNKMAGDQGIGLTDMVDERINGIKGRCLYETPGGTVLHYAVKHLKHICWNRTIMRSASVLGQNYAELVYDGVWHGPGREAIEAYFENASQSLAGSIKLSLHNGQIKILGRYSPYSLYSEQTASFESDEHGIHAAAEGYAQITRLRQSSVGRQQQKIKQSNGKDDDGCFTDNVQLVSA